MFLGLDQALVTRLSATQWRIMVGNENEARQAKQHFAWHIKAAQVQLCFHPWKASLSTKL
jgi:hypothetical protein